VARGERAGAFAQVNGGEHPPKISTNRVLVDWLVEHRGADRDAIECLTKAALWQLVEQPEALRHNRIQAKSVNRETRCGTEQDPPPEISRGTPSDLA
jgi:hypothetical protein